MSSDSSSDDEVVWTERKPIKDEDEDEDDDDDFMSLLGSSSTAARKATPKGVVAKLEAKKLKEKEDEKVRNQRELNPYVRHSGGHVKTHVGGDNSRPSSSNNSDNQPRTGTETQVGSRLSIAERNAIHAKIMKAEMLGNTELVKTLRAQLEAEKSESDGNKQGQHTDEDVKVKYYTVDKAVNEEAMSVKELYLKEKRSTRNDEVGLFVASCSKVARNPEDEYEDEEKKKKKKHKRDEDAPRRRYVNEEGDQDCKQCLKNTSRHLILHSGSHVFVTLPAHEPLTYGDCVILSISHSDDCVVSVDEDCLSEINQRKSDICRTFDKKGLAVIFMETYFRKRNRSTKHLKIECFTIKKKYEGEARMYFKKAIMECEEEWSMNKKLVDLNGKCVTRMVPKGLSYFSVCFGTQNVGYAHIIENEESFSPNFGIEILCGILDIDRFIWKRPKMQNYDNQYKRACEIKSLWKS